MNSIVISSHSYSIAKGTYDLIHEMIPDAKIFYVGGQTNEEIGTNIPNMMELIESIDSENVLVFFDIGSSYISFKMALDMVETNKNFIFCDAPIVEASFIAATMLSQPIDKIVEEIDKYKINKI